MYLSWHVAGNDVRRAISRVFAAKDSLFHKKYRARKGIAWCFQKFRVCYQEQSLLKSAIFLYRQISYVHGWGFPGKVPVCVTSKASCVNHGRYLARRSFQTSLSPDFTTFSHQLFCRQYANVLWLARCSCSKLICILFRETCYCPQSYSCFLTASWVAG